MRSFRLWWLIYSLGFFRLNALPSVAKAAARILSQQDFRFYSLGRFFIDFSEVYEDLGPNHSINRNI
ncbi:MAG: hypothetical protein CMQ39_06390 [Gammaproteobacteria bacterium]|nr:hypothetical protein [Gammaproteobacteria bacterium]